MAQNQSDDTPVRLEFAGTYEDGTDFQTVNGMGYVGSTATQYRYTDARPGDVDELVKSGKWRKLGQPTDTQTTTTKQDKASAGDASKPDTGSK